MAIIVKDKGDDKEYIVIGTGLGKYKSVSPNIIFGGWLPDEDSGETLAITVCDSFGKVGYIAAKNVEVISVDGQSPKTFSKKIKHVQHIQEN